MPHVLIVDDEVNIRRVLAAMLKREGYEVTTAADGEQALGVLNKTPVHVVVTDLVMPRLGGMELLRRVSADFPDVPVIVITAHGSVDSAVAALKAGAFDYITKPFEQDDLKKVIAKAARAHDLERQNVHSPGEDGTQDGVGPLESLPTALGGDHLGGRVALLDQTLYRPLGKLEPLGVHVHQVQRRIPQQRKRQNVLHELPSEPEASGS